MREKNLIILAILVVLTVVVSGYLVVQRNQRATPQEFQSIQPDLSRINSDRCLPLQEIQAEISCEEALKQAFLAFPGEIYNIKLENITYRANREAKPVSVRSWLVYIYPDTQIELETGKVNSIAVAVHPLVQKPYISIYFKEL